ncbi:hypothetical protein V2A60_001267 [Cordyceps javanica]
MTFFFQPPIFVVQPTFLIPQPQPQPQRVVVYSTAGLVGGMPLVMPPPATTFIQHQPHQALQPLFPAAATATAAAVVAPVGGGDGDGNRGGRVLGEVEDAQPGPQQPQQQPEQQQPEQQTLPEPPPPLPPAPAQRHPISMRVVVVVVSSTPATTSSSSSTPDTCIVQDVHYGDAPATMARVRADVANVLSQHGLLFPAAAETEAEDAQHPVSRRGVLRVTSGREAPGVQVQALGGAGGGGGWRRVVLLSPVVWECRADDEAAETFGDRIGEAARMGDWLVFVLCLPEGEERQDEEGGQRGQEEEKEDDQREGEQQHEEEEAQAE